MKSREIKEFFLPTFLLLPTEHAAGRLASPRSPRRLQPRGQVCHPGTRPDSTSQDRIGAGSPHCPSWLLLRLCCVSSGFDPAEKPEHGCATSSSSGQSLGKSVPWGWSCHLLCLHLSMVSHFPTGNSAKMPTATLSVKTKEDPVDTAYNPASSL